MLANYTPSQGALLARYLASKGNLTAEVASLRDHVKQLIAQIAASKEQRGRDHKALESARKDYNDLCLVCTNMAMEHEGKVKVLT